MNQRNNDNKSNKEGEVGTPAMTLDLGYREEDVEFLVSTTTDEGKDSNPHGRSLPERVALKTRNRLLRIGTWNVRTLYQAEKLNNALKEMDNMKLDLLGISECKWIDSGTLVKDDHIMIYSGGKEHKNGVGIIMRKEIARSLIGYWAISERLIMIKLQGKRFNISIIQIYAPTQDYEEGEIELFYDDILCVMGDLNGKVGKERTTNITGQYSLGTRDKRGERLIEFCQQNKLIITNTYFKQHPRKLYTWKSPDRETRNQIDYILINKKFRNCVKQAKTYPGSDINSDYNPVVVKMKIQLKKLNNTNRKQQLDFSLLKNNSYAARYNIEIRNRFDALHIEELEQQLHEEEHIEDIWRKVKESIVTTTKGLLPLRTKKNKQTWMTDDILSKMDERKAHKHVDRDKYNQLNKEIINYCRKAKEIWFNKQCEEI